ncbi:MAG: four helix bundle protein [Candidatus Marinimicrobia bacterium]|nr:four helix bundle protein [Candidatus Neomarinimicrobiota bacterium]
MYNTVHFIFNILSSIKMETNNSYIIYYLTRPADQIRRSSRSVSSNIAEAWRRRRCEGAFIDKLNISESEAAETQVWLEYAVKGKYLDREIGSELSQIYDNIIEKLVNMANNPKPWLLKAKMSR